MAGKHSLLIEGDEAGYGGVRTSSFPNTLGGAAASLMK